MKDNELIDKLNKKNMDLCIILGIISYTIIEDKKFLEKNKNFCDWMMEAIENVVYLDKELPSLSKLKE